MIDTLQISGYFYSPSLQGDVEYEDLEIEYEIRDCGHWGKKHEDDRLCLVRVLEYPEDLPEDEREQFNEHINEVLGERYDARDFQERQ